MLSKIFLLLIFTFSLVNSQPSYFIKPSAYFSYGDYSDKTLSNQISLFLGGSTSQSNYFVVGYDKIQLKNNLWKYEQNNYSFGVHYWFTESKLKLKSDFILIKGKYTDDYVTKPLIDNGFLVSPELDMGIYPFYYGIGTSFFTQKGNDKINSLQLYLRSDYYPHYKFLITLIPSFHLINSNLEFLTLQSSLTYFPFYELSISSTFTIGARKYYYNPDLMILFNQIDTQKGNYSIRINYNFYKNFVASILYQRSNFTNYKVDYFVVGIITKINF